MNGESNERAVTSPANGGRTSDRYYVVVPIFCLTDGAAIPKVMGTMEGGQIVLSQTSTLQDLAREVKKQGDELAKLIRSPFTCRGVTLAMVNGASGVPLEEMGLRLRNAQ